MIKCRVIVVRYQRCSEEPYNNRELLKRMIKLILMSRNGGRFRARQRSQIIQEELTEEEKVFVQRKTEANTYRTRSVRRL